MLRNTILGLLFLGLTCGPAVANIPVTNNQPLNAQREVQIPEEVARQYVIKSPAPKYPGTAKAAHIEGVVIVSAVISKEGRLTSITPVSGEPILVKAVLKALKDWRYKPFERSGEVIEVNTTIRTVFALNGKKN